MPRNEYTCDCRCINEHLVSRTLQTMPGDAVFQSMAQLHKIMGDPTRCKLIFALYQNELCVCDLANILSMTKSSISHQLSKMRTSGVVKCRREGKEVYYSLDDDHIAEIFSLSMTHISHRF